MIPVYEPAMRVMKQCESRVQAFATRHPLWPTETAALAEPRWRSRAVLNMAAEAGFRARRTKGLPQRYYT